LAFQFTEKLVNNRSGTGQGKTIDQCLNHWATPLTERQNAVWLTKTYKTFGCSWLRIGYNCSFASEGAVSADQLQRSRGAVSGDSGVHLVQHDRPLRARAARQDAVGGALGADGSRRWTASRARHSRRESRPRESGSAAELSRQRWGAAADRAAGDRRDRATDESRRQWARRVRETARKNRRRCRQRVMCMAAFRICCQDVGWWLTGQFSEVLRLNMWQKYFRAKLCSALVTRGLGFWLTGQFSEALRLLGDLRIRLNEAACDKYSRAKLCSALMSRAYSSTIWWSNGYFRQVLVLFALL